MIFYFENGMHVFIVCGAKQAFIRFKDGIDWAFTRKMANQTDKDLANE